MSSAVNLIVVLVDVVGWCVICSLQISIKGLAVNVLIAYA